MNISSPGGKYHRVEAAFEFLRGRAADQHPFTVGDLIAATGWSDSTVMTYMSKQWRDILIPIGSGRYTAQPEFSRVTTEDFKSLISQKKRLEAPKPLPEYDYDVALSFAGEDRPYVEQVAEILRAFDVNVFYDKYEQAGLWGKDLYDHLDDVYRRRSKYCILFLSKSYADKVWTNHERASAQARALESAGEYLLPARFDDTEIPGLRPTTGYIDISEMPPTEFAYLVLSKIGRRDEIEEILRYMRGFLPDYEITIEGPNVQFNCDGEDFFSEFPARLMLEMCRAGEFERMFLLPSIVPY